MEQPTTTDGFVALLDELDAASPEHGDVAVSHESGWTLSVARSRRVIWENVEEDDEARHMAGLGDAELIRLFETLAAGDLEQVETQPWQTGY